MAANPPIDSAAALVLQERSRPREHRSTEPIEFTGSGGEYFRIWIVNLTLTILTLGIYSAWAKVRRLRYFYGNTNLAGSSFEYHGEPGAILRGRLIAVAFVIPYLLVGYLFPPWDLVFLPLFLIALPFIVVRARRFQSRMSSWRGIRFDFDGRYREAARVYLLGGLLVLLTIGLWAPRWHRDRQRFLLGKTRFGTTAFDCSAGTGPYYTAYLMGGAILVVAAILFATFVQTLGVNPAAIAAAYLVFLLAVTLGRAVIDAVTINTALGGTTIGDHRLAGDLRVGTLAGIYLSNLVLVILTLGLFYPWAAVRLARYRLEHIAVEVNGDLDQFVASERENATAAGEELGDLLDVDLGL